MSKKELPLLLYKEPTISCRQNKSIITFEYFNVKKYKYEAFETDQSFSSGDTTEIEIQRKKVYTALKRGYSPDLDLVEGEFTTHTVKMEEIYRIANISHLDLVLCELRAWEEASPRIGVGVFAGFILSFGTLQFLSIIALLTKQIDIAEIGIISFLFIYFGSIILFQFIIRKRINRNYYEHYRYLPSDFKDFMSRIIIPAGIWAIIGAFYFYAKVLKMQV